MQSEPVDEQPTPPQSREDAAASGSDPASAPQGGQELQEPEQAMPVEPTSPPPAVEPLPPVPPRMPTPNAGSPGANVPLPPPPQMPSAEPAPPAWSSPPTEPAGSGSVGGSGVAEGTSADASAGSGQPPTTAKQDPIVPDEWVAEPDMAADPAASAAVAGVTQADWLASVCPYLTSEDGTYRSSQPDDGHRCTAQDPAGVPPPAFQERFCLTDRHVRCELYKYVQETHAAAAVGTPVADGDAAQPARSSSVPAAMGPVLGGRGSRRPVIYVAAGLGAAALIVFLAVLLLGGSDDPAATPEGSPSPSAELAQTPQPTPEPTLEPTAEPTPASESTPAPDTTPGVSTEPTGALLIRYEVQEGEALIKIGKAFGTSRSAILEANEGMADRSPFVATGDVIIVPVSTEMTPEELEGIPGFIAYVE